MLSSKMESDEADINSLSPCIPPARTWTGFFAQVQSQAADMAKQAQELAAIQAEKAAKVASVATKVANEKASVLVKQATEFRERYDMELATSVLMSSVGLSGGGNGSSTFPGTPNSVSPESINTGGRRNPLRLDLDYITENVMTMAFPYDPSKAGSAQQGGNDINAVSAFFRKNHRGHFMVWNISEETYDASLFSDQVLEYKFPGHPAPPLGLLFKICTSVESWLDADEENVAVVHCLTGKGRSAALAACILTWLGEFQSPMDALQYVAERKGISVEYLTIPSQRRYVQYFSNMLDGVKPRSEPLLLRRVIINSVPVFGDNGLGVDNSGCCPYLQLFKGGKLIATSTPGGYDSIPIGGKGKFSSLGNTPGESGKEVSGKMQLKWIKSSEGCVTFSVDCAVQGDILLRCRHAEASGARLSMFRAAFHTGYAPSGVLRLTKAQLDGSVSDPRFSDDFFIDLIFAPIESTGHLPKCTVSGESARGFPEISPKDQKENTIGVVGEPSDSGLVIDASSADRYEMTLHRDTRFWEAVAARKSKSKKRRTRKFVSCSTDQFSISDDLSGHTPRPEKPQDSRINSTICPLPGLEIGGKGNMSDLELIMQLARAEEEEEDGLVNDGGDDGEFGRVAALTSLQTLASRSPAASSTQGIPFTQTPPASGEAELQALEDLEKELGLGDLNLFTGIEFASELIGGGGGGGGGEDVTSGRGDDDLDELEKYLEGISK